MITKNRGVLEKNGYQAIWSKIKQNGSCNQAIALLYVGRSVSEKSTCTVKQNPQHDVTSTQIVTIGKSLGW